MPSVVVEANTTPQEAFSVPLNKIGYIRTFEIDNQAASDITITIQDVYTPSPSVANPTPTEKSVTRKVITVKAGTSYSEELKDLEIIGTCKVIASATDSACKVTLCYHFE